MGQRPPVRGTHEWSGEGLTRPTIRCRRASNQRGSTIMRHVITPTSPAPRPRHLARHASHPPPRTAQATVTLTVHRKVPVIIFAMRPVQSRISYLSAVGTLTSIVTRFTEGSFGAQGGFRAKLVRSLHLAPKQKVPTHQTVRHVSRRHGRHGSVRGGVTPVRSEPVPVAPSGLDRRSKWASAFARHGESRGAPA